MLDFYVWFRLGISEYKYPNPCSRLTWYDDGPTATKNSTGDGFVPDCTILFIL
jgi:hypothetical protein